MLLFRRFVPFLSSLILVVSLEIWIIAPRAFPYIIPFVLVTLFCSLWFLTGRLIMSRSFWDSALTPLMFIVSGLLFFLLIDNLVVRQIFIGSVAVIYMLIQLNLFSFFHHSENYQPYALENMYGYVNIITFFLLCACTSGLTMFIGWQAWWFSPLILLIAIFIGTRTFSSYKIEWRVSRIYVFSIAILVAESFCVVSVLPTTYLFNASFPTLLYYLLLSVTKDRLRETYTPARMRIYVFVSLALFIVSILTTRWF